ncbi:MAG: 16S rRNA (cytosine(967)-C(5))-methyltransferase RsmB [Terriglobales bacterium]|jgi:16S rRNA (cytosine967-C5)-methyltransferase
MAVSPSRAAAFEILLKVERDQSYASELLHSTAFTTLSSSDHGLATEIVMGVLRWQSLLDRHIAGASSQKLERLDDEVLVALRVGLYQLIFLSRVPARAAIFESVELVKAARKKSAAPFVNAILRKVSGGEGRSANLSSANARSGDALAAIRDSRDAIALAGNASHPEWLVKRWAAAYGLETVRQICLHNQSPPATSIHIHDDQSLTELVRAGVELAPGRLLSNARTVVSGDVTKTRAYEDGRIAIQDEASQLVAMLVGRGESILDCCAAPGGKTALIARRNQASIVVATELHPHRARLLRALARAPNVRVVAADARQMPLLKTFDRILADVPCSGTGTLARNPEIKWRLKEEDLADLQARQIVILKSALERLSVGGRLVYSTCSLEREENEDVVKAVLADAADFSVADCREELENLRQSGQLCQADIDVLLSGPYLRTIPGVCRCDGFFAAIVTRDRAGDAKRSSD